MSRFAFQSSLILPPLEPLRSSKLRATYGHEVSVRDQHAAGDDSTAPAEGIIDAVIPRRWCAMPGNDSVDANTELNIADLSVLVALEASRWWLFA